MRKLISYILFSLCLSAHAQAHGSKPVVDIGSRMEMFVDSFLIDSQRNLSLQLQTPVRREVVLVTDKPWEGVSSAYFTVIQEKSRVRLYYRGSAPGPDNSPRQTTCYAESVDGIHFDRPNLRSCEFQGSKENNIIYTSATLPCPGAPQIYLSFPKRFVPDRKKLSDYPEAGVSDAVFVSSRDGAVWDRTFLEAWLRPGPDPHNWTQRCNMPAWGIVQLDPAEFSLYVSEHYQWPDNRLCRVTVRRHGFASVHAGAGGGEFSTRPIIFSGKYLILIGIGSA